MTLDPIDHGHDPSQIGLSEFRPDPLAEVKKVKTPLCVTPSSGPNPFLGSFGAKIEYVLANTCVTVDYDRNEFMNGAAKPKRASLREDGRNSYFKEERKP